MCLRERVCVCVYESVYECECECEHRPALPVEASPESISVSR